MKSVGVVVIFGLLLSACARAAPSPALGAEQSDLVLCREGRVAASAPVLSVPVGGRFARPQPELLLVRPPVSADRPVPCAVHVTGRSGEAGQN